MLNKEIYNKLPTENRLVNNGVAEVSEDPFAVTYDLAGTMLRLTKVK